MTDDAFARRVEQYMKRGLDRKTAEYFAGGRKKIVSVQPGRDFTLLLEFDSGERRIYDCKPMIETGALFSAFADFENFKRVYLDESNNVAWDIDPAVDSAVVWTNKIDLCADACYLNSRPA